MQLFKYFVKPLEQYGEQLGFFLLGFSKVRHFQRAKSEQLEARAS